MSKKYDVLVTGAAGFVGRYLCEYLTASGRRVLGIDKNKSGTPCDFIQHDLTAPLALDTHFDVCVHLASSVGGILFNNKESSSIVEYNNQINNTVAQLCEKAGCDKLTFFSTINIYEDSLNFKHGPIEVAPKTTGYAMSKAAGEAFFESAIENLTVIRPTNIFGKNQVKTHEKVGESHVIPDLMAKIQASSQVEVFGDGSQVRNFVHVMDLVRFVGANLELQGHHYFNLRSEITLKISELVIELADFLGVKVDLTYLPEYMKFEKMKIEDFDMAIPQQYGWAPKINDIGSGLKV